MVDICPMQGGSEKNAICYFFSEHKLIGQLTKFQTSQTRHSCFLQITSQIFDVNYQTQNSIINILQSCITQNRNKHFSMKNQRKMIIYFSTFQNPSISTLNPQCIDLTCALIISEDECYKCYVEGYNISEKDDLV